MNDQQQAAPPRIGIAGVGMMGHGIAHNVLRHGHALTVLEHPGNQPLGDLLQAGATTCATAQALAAQCGVIILCVTGTPAVEAVLTGANGLLAGLRPGTVVVDCSTSDPASTLRMAERVAQAGGAMIDAPMTRTVQHAREGRLNLLVGGEASVLEAVRPVLRCFAENIVHVGPVGTGHRMKLLHNFVSVGCAALIAEAAACAERGGVRPGVLVDVLAAGGGGGVALERMRPYILQRDVSGLPFTLSNALKDLRYYLQMASDTQGRHGIAQAVADTLAGAVQDGHGSAWLPELVSLLAQDRAPSEPCAPSH